MKNALLFCILTYVAKLSLANDPRWLEYYDFEKIAIPKTIDPQIGGIKALKNGYLSVAFHSGEVMIYDPVTKTWSEFASGLHEPLGVQEDKSGALVVAQYPELTRLIDEDKDGKADYYQTLSDDFGMTGNYHEFVFGPAMDKQGNYYIALNVASNRAGIFQELRGQFSSIGMSQEEMKSWRQTDWKTLKKKAGRMFSKVPYRGWVLKVTPEGKTIPFASGFRSPDGIGFDNKGRLWVTDNQGDWRGTSPLYWVKQGHFYGHPASLVWKEGWREDPLKMPILKLNAMRTPASALFPQGELANSPTQPIALSNSKKFGLPKNEMLIGDMNQNNLIRFLPETVKGFTQGALIPFLKTKPLGIGNHRFDFDKQSNLWVGKTHLKWAGNEGILKISWNKKKFLIIDKVNLQRSGFKLHFNQAIDKQGIEIKIQRHRYHYHASYGSPKIDLSDVPVVQNKLSWFKKTLSIELASVEPGYLYTIELLGVKNKIGDPLMGHIIRYHAVVTK